MRLRRPRTVGRLLEAAPTVFLNQGEAMSYLLIGYIGSRPYCLGLATFDREGNPDFATRSRRYDAYQCGYTNVVWAPSWKCRDIPPARAV